MEKFKKIIPGLLFTGTLAFASMKIQNIEWMQNMHFSSLIIAIIFGILLKNTIKVPTVFNDGIKFSLKQVLRLGIILLGFKLSFSDVGQIGPNGVILVTFVTLATILFTTWLGKRLGLDRNLALLIAAGSSICGASAVAAVAPVIDAEEKDITFSIATVTVFGTIAMFLYPVLFKVLNLSNVFYAVWAGSSIHEVAQVVAAGFAAGDQAGQFATLVKLTRVLLIIPTAIILGIVQIKHQKASGNGNWSLRKITIPWFVFGFLAVIVINSMQVVPQHITKGFISLDGFLLTIAMAAMGLETSLERMKSVGMKPLYIGLAASIFISGLGYAMTTLLFA